MGAKFTVIVPQTAAISDKSRRVMANGSGDVICMSNGLAGAETISVFVESGGAWTAVFDSAGVALTMTATRPQISLPGGAHYAFDKSATSGAAGLDCSINSPVAN